MTISKAHPAAVKRDAAHRRVRSVTLGVAAVAVGVTSYGAVTLAQMTADNGSVITANQQGATASHVSSGSGQAPAASSGGS